MMDCSADTGIHASVDMNTKQSPSRNLAPVLIIHVRRARDFRAVDIDSGWNHVSSDSIGTCRFVESTKYEG